VKSNLRAALAVLLTSVLAVSGLSPVFANIYPTAHVAWGGARIDATQGVGVGITPSGSNPNTSWTYFSDPCGPGSVSSAFCFETGILSNHSAWFRMEYANANDARFVNVPGSNCATNGVGNDVFKDAGSTELSCSLAMPDFSNGTTFNFNVRPDFDASLGVGNWWTIRYANNSTGISQTIGVFRYDLTPTVLQTMSSFGLSEQMNGTLGTTSADCSTIPNTAGVFSQPYDVTVSSDNSGHMVSRGTFAYGGSSSTCTPFTGNYDSTTSTVSLSFGQSAGSSTTNYSGSLIRPSNGGQFTTASCPQGEVAVGLRVSNTIGAVTFNFVQLLQIYCANASTISYGPSTTDQVTFVNQGPGNASSNIAFCPTGSAISGLNLATGAYVKDIGFSCIDRTSGTVTQVSTVGAGVGLPTDSSSKCPLASGAPTFLRGISGYAAAGVDGIQAQCDVFATNSTSTSTPGTHGVITLATTPQDLITACDTQKAFTEPHAGPAAQVLALGRSTQQTSMDLLVYEMPLGTCLGVDIYPAGSQSASLVAAGLVNELNATSDYATKRWTTNFRILVDTSSLGCNPFIAKPWYVTNDIRTYYGNSWQSDGCSGFPASSQLLGSIKTFSPLSAYPNEQIEAQQRATQSLGSVAPTPTPSSSPSQTPTPTPSETPSTTPKLAPSPSSTPTPSTKPITPPKNLSFSYSKGVIRLTVDLPTLLQDGITAVSLISDPLGYSSASPLLGQIDTAKSQANFELPVTPALSGKSVPIQVYAASASAQSAPLVSTLPIPKVSAASVPSAPRVKPSTGAKGGVKTPSHLLVPLAPTNPSYHLSGAQVVVSVDAPAKPNALATGALLIAPALGVSQSHPIVGHVSGGKATFALNLNPSMAGKSAQISIYLTNAAGSSAPLAGQVSLPPVIPGAEGSGSGSHTQEGSHGPASVTCAKGSVSRTFTATACPPGWVKK